MGSSLYNHHRDASGASTHLVGFEVLTAVSMKMAVFWVVAL
jgi:hypothetical protein